MKVLFVTNLYPPHDLGGWEQNCQEIVDHLRERGHDCHVLTSNYGTNNHPEIEQGVTRSLYLEADVHYYQPLGFYLRHFWQERANRRVLRRALDTFRPDVVYIWGMWDLSRRVAYWVERWVPGRVAYAIASYWLTDPNIHEVYWQQPTWKRWAKVLMMPVQYLALQVLARERKIYPLNLAQVACVSKYVLQKLTEAGVLLHGGRVIYNGIDPQPFLNVTTESQACRNEINLVYIGGLLSHKGVHTAVEALGLLRQRGEAEGMILTLVGGGHPDYEALLRRRVTELGLDEQVVFHGRVPRDQIPAILHRSDIFLFTSIWEEPIARTVMEAMAAGLAVIGTGVGGQCEMLQDGVNALVFPPEDVEQLASCIKRLQSDADERLRLAEAGQRTVLEHFTLDRMVNEIEAWLLEIVG